MPTGAGFSAAGLSPAGLGTPDAAPAPNSVALPDAITGLPQTGRLLDPATKDHRFTQDGRIVGQGTAQQLVQLALSTTLGSSASTTLGIDKAALQMKGPDALAQATTIVTDALEPIVASKQVQLNSVATVDSDPSDPPGRLGIVAQWTDTTTIAEQDTVI